MVYLQRKISSIKKTSLLGYSFSTKKEKKRQRVMPLITPWD